MRARVLLVAPTDLVPELGRTLLWRKDFERVRVPAAEVACELARDGSARLVVIDGADAVRAEALVRKLRSDPATRSLGLVVLSRRCDPAEEDALLRAGANVVMPEQTDPFLWDVRLESLLDVPPRREARLPVRIQAWSRSDGREPVLGLALNVSLRGMLFECGERLELGTKLDVGFRLPDGPGELAALGQVARHAGADGRRVGIEFLVLRGDARERLRAFVDAAGPAGEAPAEPIEWEAQLRDSEALKDAILEAALDPVATIGADGRLQHWNAAAIAVFGWSREDALGRRLLDLVVAPDVREGLRRGLARDLAAGEGPFLGQRLETTGLRRDGSTFPLELALSPVSLPRRRLYAVFLRDVSERKWADEQIRSLAYHDVLTGLPNRILLRDRLHVALAQARRLGRKLALIHLDLDRFKVVNESLGHGFGDRLLQQVADRLRACMRQGDTVARLGGDEFTALVQGLKQPEDALAVADKVLRALRAAYQVDGREVFLSASLGISVAPDDGDDPELLLRNADSAMYRAKAEGRDTVRAYTPAMNARALESLALESRLRSALSRQELEVHYQPVVELKTGRVTGLEALVRWRHPELGLLLPGDFLALAGAAGLLGSIGDFVLRSACQQARAWRSSLCPDLSMAVNVSQRQLQAGDLAVRVEAVLRETGLPGEALELEITESDAMADPEQTVAALVRLRSCGVRVSIDDFGTGYSSLSHLKRLPIDTLKIDKSFVRDVTTDPDAAAIAATVLAMAHTMRLGVVAEGVETEGQRSFLASLGCPRGQGYLFARALAPDDCAAYLAADPARAFRE